MVETGIMAGICTSPCPSSYPIEKVGDSSYPYPYQSMRGFAVKTGTGSGNTTGTSLFVISNGESFMFSWWEIMMHPWEQKIALLDIKRLLSKTLCDIESVL